MAPYDWTRVTPGEVTPQSQEREPARWAISLLVATVVGIAVAFLVLLGYILLGLDKLLPDGVGGLLGIAGGIAVAMFTWRGIRARWHRMPAGPADRWDRPTRTRPSRW